MKQNISRIALQTIGCMSILYAAQWFRISYLLGGATAYFSGINIVAPLAGAYGLSSAAALFFVVRAMLMHGFFTCSARILLALHLPTLAAAWCWSFDHVLYRVGVPLTCIVLFLMHPAGLAAPFYAIWWLIPSTLFFVQRSIFATAVASTFTAHAVGTVLWMYVHPLSPELYAQLMPIVLVERLVYASGMTLAYYALAYARNVVTTMVYITKKA